MMSLPHGEKPEHSAAVNHSLPVQLPPEAIEEFQAIWKNHYGEEIGRDEATARAHQLLALLQFLAEPEDKASY